MQLRSPATLAGPWPPAPGRRALARCAAAGPGLSSGDFATTWHWQSGLTGSLRLTQPGFGSGRLGSASCSRWLGDARENFKFGFYFRLGGGLSSPGPGRKCHSNFTWVLLKSLRDS